MKLNISAIEQDSVLRDRLKDAARDSIRDFFPGREPAEEAVEYVFVAFCLNEDAQQFSSRLSDLFEKDCTSIVQSLSQFVEAHKEFVVDTESEVKKEKPKKRHKIVWNASLEAKESEEKKKKPSLRRKASRSLSPRRVIVKSPSKEHGREPHGGKMRRLSPNDESLLDRWQPEGCPEIEMKNEVKTDALMKHDIKTEQAQRNTQLKVPRNRLFESALGGIKQQIKQGMKKTDDHDGRRSNNDGHGRSNHNEVKDFSKTESWASSQKLTATEQSVYPSGEAMRPYMPSEHQGSILDRIRKPDGSAFEDWELLREPHKQTRKREVAQSTPRTSVVKPQATVDASEVESLKEKVALLEKEVQKKHHMPQTVRIVPARVAQDANRCSICVRNIHPIANEEILAAHFHSCLPILQISFARDHFGRRRNYCFLQFADEASVERALELDRSLLLGMPIQVTRKFSRSSEWRQPWNHGTLKQDWHREDGTEIKDFAIDTGSQDMM